MSTDELLAIARAATPGDPDVWADADVIDRYNAAFRPARVIALLEERKRLLEFVQAWDALREFQHTANAMDMFEYMGKEAPLVVAVEAKRRALDEA